MGTFTDTEKVNIRRHCGYPAYGSGNNSFNAWRYFEEYGLLEFRMNNMAPAEEAHVRTYLATLDGLETAIIGVGENLDTAQAAVWTRNPDEHRDREVLYHSFRIKLCAFMGVSGGDGLKGMSRNRPMVV